MNIYTCAKTYIHIEIDVYMVQYILGFPNSRMSVNLMPL